MGIPIKLHVTFLLILPFIAFAFATSPAPLGFNNVPDMWVRVGLSLLAAIFLFACVLIHEIGHSYIAVKNGIKIGGITLFLFGGVSEMEDIPRNPKVEMVMAFIGPAISIVLGVIFAAIFFFVFRDIIKILIIRLYGHHGRPAGIHEHSAGRLQHHTGVPHGRRPGTQRIPRRAHAVHQGHAHRGEHRQTVRLHTRPSRHIDLACRACGSSSSRCSST